MASVGRPIPTRVYHFTHLSHLRTVVRDGLICDSLAQQAGVLQHEAGNLEIKQRRRSRPVTCDPGGVVADYVPFYYNPRSPMLYAIFKGNVPTYEGRYEDLVFLGSTTQTLRAAGLMVAGSDRNASMDLAKFSRDDSRISTFTRWDVMDLTYWHDATDGGELRQAECLVHQEVPWACVEHVGVKHQAAAEAVRRILTTSSHRPRVTVRPDWYF